MDETLDVWLPPWFAISNSALQGNSLKKIELLLKSYKNLFNSKWMWACVCPICNMTACKLMEENGIMGFPSHYSICPSQLKYKMKKFWLKASELYEQLLNSVTLSHKQRCVYVWCILNNPSLTLVKNGLFLQI